MPSVSSDDVRDAINISSSDIPDAKVLKMIKRAETTLELETGEGADHGICTEAEKASAIIRYCACKLLESTKTWSCVTENVKFFFISPIDHLPRREMPNFFLC